MRPSLKLLTAAFFAAASTALSAQSFPTKPIKLLIPYAPGGTTDIMARALQEPLQKSLGQPVVVENRAGGAGSIAMREAARAQADGYTLVFANNGQIAVTPVVQKDAQYDGVKDFTPIGTVSTAAMYAVVYGGMQVNTLQEFIDYARKNPNGVEYATAGVGSFGHLSSELFARAANIKMVHVPYKGQGPTVNSVMTGETKLLITSPSASMHSHIESGKLKLLGVGSAERFPLQPQAPTIGSVLPGYRAESWFMILAPAGTPKSAVTRLNGALNAALGQADIQERFKNFGLITKASTPEQLGQMMVEEVKRWGDVIRQIGIKAE